MWSQVHAFRDMKIKQFHLMMPRGVRILLLLKSHKIWMVSVFIPNWIYLFFGTSWYCMILFSKEWLVMLSIFVLYTSPAADPVMWPVLWYIQIAFSDCFWVLWYKQWYSFWMYAPLYLWYWSSYSFLSSVSEKFILAGLSSGVKNSGGLSLVSDKVCFAWPVTSEPVNFSVFP